VGTAGGAAHGLLLAAAVIASYSAAGAPPDAEFAAGAPPDAVAAAAAVATPVAAVAATGEPSPGAENAEMGPP
tara:strand:+ start:717 stop:935 length:219 start_codon:yes stop_codon:yes gene_type:complete